jgi:hypothetical protein
VGDFGQKARLMNQPPDWMQSLADEAGALIHPVDLLAPLGCHYCEVNGVWEITLFASQTEILGGPLDGGLRASRFHVDLAELIVLFDEVSSAYWQALGLGEEDDLGPHVGIEGRYAGHDVWLRILANAPKRFPPGRVAHVQQGTWEELW